jgi:peptide deformylase
MAIRPIVDYPAAVLLNPGDPVESFDGELETLVQDMFDTMYDAEGVGLAADAFVLSKARSLCFRLWLLARANSGPT